MTVKITDLPNDAIGIISRNLGDYGCRLLAQTNKQFSTQTDQYLSAPAKELKRVWNGDARQNLLAQPYRDLQKTIQFAKRLPANLGSLDTERATDPARYEYIDAFRSFCEKLPPTLVDVLVSYPHHIPKLDLGGRMGDTGKIDFLTGDDLQMPVVRGVDKLSRPFFAVRAVCNTELRQEAEHTQAFFAPVGTRAEKWYFSHKHSHSVITETSLREDPQHWKAIMVELFTTGQASETYTSFFGQHTANLRLSWRSDEPESSNAASNVYREGA